MRTLSVLVICIAITSSYANSYDECVKSCVERFLQKDIIEAVAWNVCVHWKVCEDKIKSNVNNNTKKTDSNDLKELPQRCVDDIDEVIEDIQRIPGIYQRRDIGTALKYIKDIVLLTMDGVTVCRAVTFGDVIDFISQYVPEKYRTCYTQNTQIVFHAKKIVELWEQEDYKQVSIEMDQLVSVVKQTWNTCKQVVQLNRNRRNN